MVGYVGGLSVLLSVLQDFSSNVQGLLDLNIPF